MRNHQGFTLIELMVTISVAAIIMALAVPSMKLMQANARMASAANDLASDLKKTRSDAISYRTNYTFVPNGGTNWSNGWLATYNISDSANAAVSTKTSLQKVSLPPSITVAQNVTSLLFNGTTGRLSGSDGVPVDVTFVVCDSSISTEMGYSIVVNRFGRVLIQRHTKASDCPI